MKNRIEQIMEYEGLSASKFAEAIGIQRAAMSHIISGRNNLSLDVFKKILETFTYIDSDWLLSGKGKMMRKSIMTSVAEPDLFSNVSTSPIIQPEVQSVSEYRKENVVKTPSNTNKQAEIEPVIVRQVVSKKVSKIVVFYSDDTFETFIPEKTKKE
jgi:Plasmid maintenance system antidote protein